MSNVPVTKLFKIISGTDLELNKLEEAPDGINFVSRNRNNNGVVARVKAVEGKNPLPANTISVALSSSSTMYSYYQEEPYYTAYHVAALEPINRMTKNEMLFYCTCLIANRYKYNWGRQADKTLCKILIPDITDIPDWVDNIQIKDLTFYKQRKINTRVDLFSVRWHEFNLYPDLFEMEPGDYVPSSDYGFGNVPYVSSCDTNNGIGNMTNLKPMFSGNKLTIGKVNCSTYYQAVPFCATSDVTVLSPKFEMNQYIGLFIATVINQNSFKWNYGRQIRLNNCKDLKVFLPAIQISELDYVPDYHFMECYIKHMAFSKML